MYKLIIVLSLFAIIRLSCDSKHSTVCEIDYMEVSYIKGTISPHTPLVCGQISSMFPELKEDTILTDAELLISVDNFIKQLLHNEKKVDYSVCDIRIQCTMHYKDNSSKTLCVGKFNCIELNGKYVGESDSLSYLIKQKTGYYNFFDESILNQFKEIQQFGIPIDYKSK